MSEPTVWAKAKAEIQRRGWYQGDYGAPGDDTGRCAVCLAGAVCAAVTNEPWDDMDPVSDAALSRLADHLGMQVGPWNDAPDRTVDEVYALLDELDAAERGAS